MDFVVKNSGSPATVSGHGGGGRSSNLVTGNGLVTALLNLIVT